MNKRGMSNVVAGIVLVAIIVGSIFIIGYSSEANQVWKTYSNPSSVSLSYGEVISSNFAFLDYILGRIPEYLYNWPSGTVEGGRVSAVIISIGIWLIFLLSFGDIITAFGFFSNKAVSWTIAIVLTIIAANIQLIKVISVFALAITSIVGTVSVLLSIVFIFVLFILFVFGSSGLRQRLIVRRAEDTALRSVAGGASVAGAVEGLGDIGKALAKIGGKSP